MLCVSVVLDVVLSVVVLGDSVVASSVKIPVVHFVTDSVDSNASVVTWDDWETTVESVVGCVVLSSSVVPISIVVGLFVVTDWVVTVDVVVVGLVVVDGRLVVVVCFSVDRRVVTVDVSLGTVVDIGIGKRGFSHNFPVKPTLQLHSKLLKKLIQVAPFLHGLLSHLRISSSQNCPLYPDLQQHLPL